MKTNKTQLALQILFYGAIWGIVEATVGYALHSFFPVFLSGTLMFPFVSLILYKAYKATDSKKALIWISLVAAAIKAVDFFLPQIIFFKTLNPMISMVSEALMVVVVITLFEKQNIVSKLSAFVVASFGWRAIFLAVAGIQYLVTGFVVRTVASVSNILEFGLTYALISGAVASIAVYLAFGLNKNRKPLNIRVTPVLSTASVILAVVLTLVFAQL